MLIVMAIKPCKLVLKVMKEKESSNSSEASTPEEYLTPSGDSVLLSDYSAFSFPDLDIQSSLKPLDNAVKLDDKVDNIEPINLDENSNNSKTRCGSPSKSTCRVMDSSNVNNNLDKHFKALEKDMETKPTKLMPEKQNHSPSKSIREMAADNDLTIIRKKLEDRRCKMEMEKRRQEQQWCRQRQAINKEAYSTLFGGDTQNPNDFHLSSDSKPKALLNGKDNSKPQSSGYYKQDSAIAMERLFANEELVDTQLNSGTLDRNLLKKQKAAREMANTQQAKLLLDRKKTSSFREPSLNKNKNSEHRHSVDQNYGLSLDRLNSSLSELQGEIMRLSLQQDHIKNLVTLSDSPSHSISAPQPQRVSNTSRHDHAATSSRTVDETARSTASFVGDPNVSKSHRSSAFRKYNENRGQSERMGQAERQESFKREYLLDHIYQDDLQEQLLNQQGNIPYAHPAIIPTISPYPFLHPFHPPPYFPYAMNPYFQPYPAQPHYSLRSRPMVRNFDYRARDGQLKRDLSLGGILDPRSSSRHHELPRRDSFSASRSSYLPSRNVRDPKLARPSSVVSDYFSTSHISSFDPRSSLDHDAIYFQPRLARNPSYSGVSEVLSRRASEAFYASDPADDSSLSRFPDEVEMDQMADDTATEQSEIDVEEEPVKPLQQPEFFEVNLEAAKRPKPEIGLQRRSKGAKESPQPSVLLIEDKLEKPNDIQNVAVVDLDNEVSMDDQLKSDDEKTETGSVGFIIEDTNLDPSLSAEVEKKRNKLAELHEKRKEELQAKKNIINKNQQVKREQLRLKEEKTQKKKNEEKQRRDLIFQKYLQKKAEMSETNSDDDSIKQFAINNSNQYSSVNQKSSSKLRPPSHGKKHQRPQSQLVIGSAAREAGSDFSDDCSIIITAVKHPQTADAKLPSTPDAGSYADGKKSAQERLSRFLSCEGEKVEDGSGLKLFVKPNQKSNRSIIINAIKDCCLAGVVNQELKDKVIEEINRSDAKHFVVLFRDGGLQYRGLYSFNLDKQEVHKIQGVGPKQLLDKNMDKFYKYNSGSKNFSEVTSTRHLSSTIDGVTISSCLWSKKQPATPRKMTT